MNTQAKKVLIVDDEPQLCLLIGDKLSAGGFDCHTVTDLEEARDMLETERYDVLIAELQRCAGTQFDPDIHGRRRRGLVRPERRQTALAQRGDGPGRLMNEPNRVKQ